VNVAATLLPKYLRLRREWQLARPGSGHHQRLSDELAELERGFLETGVTLFADTQPCEYVERTLKESAR
jgi:hypothetical protein